MSTSLGDDELSDLCFDEFRAVYDQFTSGQTRSMRVRLLVEYVDHHGMIDRLLTRLKRDNPKAFAEAEPRLKAAAGAEVSEFHPTEVVPTASEQVMANLIAGFAYKDPVSAHKSIRALQNWALTLALTDPARERAIDALKGFLTTDLGVGPVSSTARGVRQEIVRGITCLATRSLGAYFRDRELERQDLWAIDFSNADLSGVSFREAFLIESDFANAILRGASFDGACVRNVKFHNADVSGTDLSNTDWFNALGWTSEQLMRAQQPLPPCPKNETEFRRRLKDRYAFPFKDWTERVQQELVATWADYTRPGGLRDSLAETGKPKTPNRPKKPAQTALPVADAGRKIKILFLAANPAGMMPLALDEEAREIGAKVRAAKHGQAIELVCRWAVRPDDLLQSLNEVEPDIVHFSGHGDPTRGILLLDRSGTPKPVTRKSLVHLFRTMKSNVRVVLLNACYSRSQAEAITEVIDCAIGINEKVDDANAITFAASFYRAIAFGSSVRNAFEQGTIAVMLEGEHETNDEQMPELLVKPGADVEQMTFFASTRPESLGRTNVAATGKTSLATDGPVVLPAAFRDQVFISYSHKDRKWLDELQTMLKPLVWGHGLTIWDDTRIVGGAKWRSEIDKALAAAKVALLLVSGNFLASEFIVRHELSQILKAAEDAGVTILWVPVSASLYKETALARFQAAHDPAQPLDTLSPARRKAAMVAICEKIKAAAEANR